MEALGAYLRRIRGVRGETLVEVLASILISTLSVALLFGYIMTSSSLDRKAQETDKEHYKAITEADGSRINRAGTGTTTITRIDPEIDGVPKSVEIDVDIFGGEGMYSYREPQS